MWQELCVRNASLSIPVSPGSGNGPEADPPAPVEPCDACCPGGHLDGYFKEIPS